MANISDRMQWSYPSKDEEPWYDVFESTMIAQDASGYAAREDRQLIFTSSAGFSFNATSGLLSWNNAIDIVSSITGFYMRIPAGSATLADSQVFYITVTRALSGSISVAAKVGNNSPNTDDDYAIAIRRGSSVFFRNGKRLDDGTAGFDIFGAFSALDASDTVKGVTKLSVAPAPGNPIACGINDPILTGDRTASGLRTTGLGPLGIVVVSGAAPPVAGQHLRATSPTAASWQTSPGSTGDKILAFSGTLGLGESHNSATPRVTGGIYINPSQWAMSGTTMAASFDVIMACGNTPLTVNAKLRCVSGVYGAYDVATIPLVDTVTQTYLQFPLTIFVGDPTPFPGTGKINSTPAIYEVHIWVVAPGSPLDTVELSSATFSIVNTIM